LTPPCSHPNCAASISTTGSFNIGSPLAHFITISCYGARLHGDARGTVDKFHNAYGTPRCAIDPRREAFERRPTIENPYVLDAPWREIVVRAIRSVSHRYGWIAPAWHVRWNHLHAILRALQDTDLAMRAINAEASRLLNHAGLDDAGRRRWAPGGSAEPLLVQIVGIGVSR
jgi:hypothetical protein